MSGVISVTVDFGAEIKRQFSLQVDAYISQETVDHGLELWDLWSKSPDCDVVSVTNPLDRGSRRPWHDSYVIVEQWRWQLGSLRDAGADDSRAVLDTPEASCSLSPSQTAGQPSSDGGRHVRPGNVEYHYVTRHCIKGSCQVYGLTHCTVWWFPLVEACLNVCFELEEGRCSVWSRVDLLLVR